MFQNKGDDCSLQKDQDHFEDHLRSDGDGLVEVIQNYRYLAIHLKNNWIGSVALRLSAGRDRADSPF